MNGERLIIIGNGFDLQAGLKSSYSDFFKSDFAVNANNFWINILNHEMLGEYNRWGDIEGLLAEVLNDSEEWINQQIYCRYMTELKLPKFWQIEYGDYNRINRIKKHQLEWKKWEEELFGIDAAVLAIMCAEEIYNFVDKFKDATDEIRLSFQFMGYQSPERYSSHGIRSIERYVRNFLYNELKEFELLFTRYLSNEVLNTIAYKRKANQLLLRLSDIGTTKHANTNDTISLLSFNYTNPFLKNLPMKLNIKNVHGDLKNENIIFGVDAQSQYTSNEETKIKEGIVPFTKARRILEQGGRNKKWCLPREISEIIIYGHSLSYADNSYFYSVFDVANIYESQTTIILAYSKYNEDFNLGPIKDILFNLITSYGLKMTNKQQGKNLVHRLVLENRIQFIEI